MKVIARFEDNEYPFTGITHTRQVVRGVIFNDEGKIALIKVKTHDIFGDRDLYETPGGGKDKGETLLNALKREIYEEVGAEIDHIQEIGRVLDYYNFINRRNDNRYYLAHISKLGERHLVDYEKRWEQFDLVYMDIDEAIEAYKNTKNLPVNNLVRQREIPILLKAKRMMKKIGVIG